MNTFFKVVGMNKPWVRAAVSASVLFSVFGLPTATAHDASPAYSADDLVDGYIQFTHSEREEGLNAEARAQMRAGFVDDQTIAAKARLEGFDRQKDVQAMRQVQENHWLAQQYLRSKAARYQPPEADVHALYLARKQHMSEYHLRHILLDTQAQAVSVIARLHKGESFIALAKKQSKDSGSAKQGGDLGWMPLDAWVPEFAQAAQQLPANGVTPEPVKTQFGYHVIQSLGAPRVPKGYPNEADSVGDLQNELREAYMTQLRAQILGKTPVGP